MITPQSPLTSLESAAKEGFGEAELALNLQQHAQVVERRERVGMVGLPKSAPILRERTRVSFVSLADFALSNSFLINRALRRGRGR